MSDEPIQQPSGVTSEVLANLCFAARRALPGLRGKALVDVVNSLIAAESVLDAVLPKPGAEQSTATEIKEPAP